MSFFSAKNLIIFGVLILLLVGIPVGVYLAQQQQETESQAEQSSSLSFVPVSNEVSPKEVEVGEEFTLDIMVDPGTNKVSVVAFEINYDPTLIKVSETTPFAENKLAFPVVMDTPVFEDGIIRGRVSTESVAKAVGTPTKVATLKFVALEETTTPTAISFGAPFTQILSAGSQDEAGENVLSSTAPAYIATTLAEPSDTPVEPTQPVTQVTPIVQPTSVVVPGNTNPSCTTLTANGALQGVAPFAGSFTANATDPDGTVSKVTYNFGDGQVSDVLSESQVTASGSATSFSAEHTYTTAGTFKVTALATDNKGGVSAQGQCELSMTITSPEVSPTPIVTMEPTGPTETFIGIGIVTGILTFLGGLLFFTL